MLDLEKIQTTLDQLWERYEFILQHPNWEDMNEARAILYLTGRIYCEQIAVGAIERRLSHIQPPLKLVDFFLLIDQGKPELESYRKDPSFLRLEKFYRIVKVYKNKYVGGKHYKNEEKFIEFYNTFAPTNIQKTSYKGIIDLKKERDSSS